MRIDAEALQVRDQRGAFQTQAGGGAIGSADAAASPWSAPETLVAIGQDKCQPSFARAARLRYACPPAGIARLLRSADEILRTPPAERITARSITFCSSRTFPGQS